MESTSPFKLRLNLSLYRVFECSQVLIYKMPFFKNLFFSKYFILFECPREIIIRGHWHHSTIFTTHIQDTIKKPRKSMGYMYRYLIKYGGQGEKLVQSQRSRVKSSISNYLSASNVTINPLKKLSDLYVFIYLKRLGDRQNTHQM